MTASSWDEALALLRDRFPLRPISCSQLDWYPSKHSARIADELFVANLCGLSWLSISVEQARVLCEVLFLTNAAAGSCLLPGFLMHLRDTEQADVLVDDIPEYLLEVLETRLQSPPNFFFTREQIIAISEFFSYLVAYNPGNADDDVTTIWALVSKEYEMIATQFG